MTYVIFYLSDLFPKNRPTKPHENTIFPRKTFFTNLVCQVKGDNYDSEVNSSITFKPKIT